MGLNVGIDFGTSNSGVALFDGSRVRLLPVDRQTLTPEVVKTILYITRDYQAFIGQEAVELYYKHNVNRLRRFVKKWVGEIDVYGGDMHYVRDVYVYVDELKPGRLLQYIKTALRSANYEGTQIFDRYYSLGDLITIYLRLLKERAEDLLGETIQGVTLGRPVHLNNDPDLDREAEHILHQAAREAGFTQVQLELEPVAAALFYESTLTRPETVLIFDFGGGTLDLTVMRLGERKGLNGDGSKSPRGREVLASGGIGLAGSDFDRAIIQKRMMPHFGGGIVQHDPDLSELIQSVADWAALPDLSTPQARLRLETAIQQGHAPVRLKALESLIFNDLAFSFYQAVEGAKIELSEAGASVIRLQEKDINVWELYTRAQFEKDIREHREQIEKVLLETVIASGLEPEQIDAVVKTGGSSSIPAFTEMLESIFGTGRVKQSATFSSVTAGLAIRAHEM